MVEQHNISDACI